MEHSEQEYPPIQPVDGPFASSGNHKRVGWALERDETSAYETDGDAINNEGNRRNSILRGMTRRMTRQSSFLKTMLHTKGTCTLTWTGLGYVAPTRPILNSLSRIFPFIPQQQGKVILTDLSGCAKPGELVAVMGPSGSGKTSFLNILANRIPLNEITGDLRINGEVINTLSKQQLTKYDHIIGYVYQHETLIPYLTVREVLFYAAVLTLPQKLSVSEKMERVEVLIHELGLNKCANTFVGNALIRGISGGEKRRLSIGIELLRNPGILILDEPTSGLDAKTALILTNLLHKLAVSHQRTIITSIHQPRAQIFYKYHNVLLLSPFGTQIYFGPVSQVLTYFDTLGFRCPNHENPSDFILDQIAIDYNSPEAQEHSLSEINYLIEHWKTFRRRDSGSSYVSQTVGLEHVQVEKKASTFSQIFWLFHRESISQYRNQKFLVIRFLQSFIIPFFLAWLYFRLDDDQPSIIDRKSLLFFAISTVSFNELFAAIAEFLSGSEIYYRERNGKIFTSFAYWGGKQLALLPYQLFFPFVWIMSIYWISGLQITWYQFFIFLAVVELCGLAANSLGLTFGALLSPAIASTVASLVLITLMMFVGFLINVESIPAALRWISYIHFGRWAYDAVTQNEFYGLDFTCDEGDFRSDGSGCPFVDGEQVVEGLNLSQLAVWQDMLILLAFIVVFRTIFLLALRYTGRN